MNTNRIVADYAKYLILLVAFRASLVCSADAAAQGFKFLEVQVVDEQGKPMADVQVEVRADGMKFPLPTNEQGVVSLNFSAGRNPVELFVRHPGYESQQIRWRRASEVPAKHTFEMQHGKPLHGLILDSAGHPVVAAEVYVAPPDRSLTFLNGKNLPDSEQAAVLTDEQGNFTLPFLAQGSTIVCLSDLGWAELVKTTEKLQRPLELRLTPWAQVELKTHLGKKERTANIVGLYFLKSQGAVKWRYRGVTNQQDKFTCDRVISGTAMAYCKSPLKLLDGQPAIANRSHGVIIQPKAGANMQVALGEETQSAAGRLFLPAEYRGAANWESGYAVLIEDNTAGIFLRTAIFEYGKALSQSFVFRPDQRVQPSGHPNYLVRYLTPIQADGSFVIENIPPGYYKLSVAVTAQQTPNATTIDVLSLDGLPFNIPLSESENGKPFDLGEHILDHTDSFDKIVE